MTCIGENNEAAPARRTRLSAFLIIFIIRGDTRVTPEDKQRLAELRAAEIPKRRADFNAINN